MMNLRITIYLRAPVCLNHPWIHFDGILAHLALRRRMGIEYYLLPTFRVEDISGILDGILDFRDGVPCASVSILEPDGLLFSLSQFKRFERKHSDTLRKRRVDIGSGHFRDWRLTVVYSPARAIVFFARGDRDAIESLLGELIAIGNDYRVGWGEIHRLQVDEIGQDYSIVMNGRAMRPIPIDRLEFTSEVVPLAWRPPYWARENIAPCAPPGAEVQWK